MASRKKFRSAGVAAMIAFVLVAAGCSSSSDPGNWVDADASGKIEENFDRACTEGNVDSAVDAASLADYCGCSYDDLRSAYDADFEGFLAVNDALGSEPESVPPNVVAIFEACASAHLPS